MGQIRAVLARGSRVKIQPSDDVLSAGAVVLAASSGKVIAELDREFPTLTPDSKLDESLPKDQPQPQPNSPALFLEVLLVLLIVITVAVFSLRIAE